MARSTPSKSTPGIRVTCIIVGLALGSSPIDSTDTRRLAFRVNPVETAVQSGAFHEPPGMKKFFHTDGSERDFGRAWAKGPKWLNDKYTQVVADPTNPTGSGKAIEKRWFAGDRGDNGGGLTTLQKFSKVGGFPARVLYVRMRVKFSPNYDVTPNYGGMKFGYWGMQNGPNATYMYWVNTDGMKPYAFLGAQNVKRHYFGPPGFFKVGVWHTLEMVITAQSANGIADGRYEWWVDGTKVVDADNQRFVNAQAEFGPLLNGYQQFFIRGSHRITFKVDDWVRLGELYISGK